LIFSIATQGRPRPSLLLIIALCIPVVLVVLPLAYVVLRASEAGWTGVTAEIFRTRTLVLLVNTSILAVTVTGATAVIGAAGAWLVERTDLAGRRIWRVALTLPLAVPAFVASYAWATLGDAFQGMGGAILILTLSTYPLVYLPVAAALRGLDPALEEVSRSLGRSGWTTFTDVVMPQIRPALGAGALLVFTHMLAEFGALALLRVQTFTTAIFESYQLQFDSATAALQSAVLMLLCLPVAYGEMRLRAGVRVAPVGRGARRVPGRARLGPWQIPAAAAGIALLVLALGVPVTTLLYWFSVGTSRGQDIGEIGGAIAGSLWLSLPGALFVTLLALPLVLVSTRHGGRLALIADRLPYIVHGVPGLVIALALTFLAVHFVRPLYQSALLVYVAYAVLFLPLAQSALRASVELAPPRLDEAARSLGRGPFAAFLAVTLPLIAPGIGAALALMTLELMRELTATLLLAPTGMVTLSTAMWSHTNDVQYAASAPFAVLLVLLSALPVYFFTRRSLALYDA
jgi:iron(III) transport system permease protein